MTTERPDRGARALAERLRDVDSVPGRDSDRRAAAILTNGAVFLLADEPEVLYITVVEYERLRRIETAARAYIMADDRDMDAVAERERDLAAALEPEGSAQ